MPTCGQLAVRLEIQFKMQILWNFSKVPLFLNNKKEEAVYE